MKNWKAALITGGLWAVAGLGTLNAEALTLEETLAPLNPINIKAPEYPFRLTNIGVWEGQVHVIIEVGADGDVQDHLVTAYSHPLLKKATEEAIEDWRFAPTDPDDPTVRTVSLTMRFQGNSEDGFTLVEDSTTRGGVEAAGVYASKPTPVRELDRPLQVVQATQPTYIKEWAEEGAKGSAIVAFYIDKDGSVRVPTVVSADHPWLASVARDAVKQWQFQPPMADGEPTIVRVMQKFDFDPQAETAAQ